MSLEVVRSLGSARFGASPSQLEDFEQELVDQYVLALVGAGLEDRSVAFERSVIFELIEFLDQPVWTTTPDDADRYLAFMRKERRLAKSTVQGKAGAVARFFDFLIARYQGDIHALAGSVVVQPIDEFNRPTNVEKGQSARVPPRTEEVEVLFSSWSEALPDARKFLPAARDYMAASLWRRVGLRINETVMLDVGDWRPDLGDHGKLHVRFGKGSRGRGAKPRLVPGINAVDDLMAWRLEQIRPQFGDDHEDPGAPLLPSERHDQLFAHCARIGSEALRAGLAHVLVRWLPEWNGKLTPHGLRHFCASSLYERGMDLKAIQDLLGHEWLSTTTRYVHVHDGHIEHAWAAANERTTARLSRTRR